MPSRKDLTEEEIKKAILECKTKLKAAAQLGVSIDCLRRNMKDLGLFGQIDFATERVEFDEDTTYEKLEEASKKAVPDTIGQGEATILFTSDEPFLLTCSADWHFGSKGTDEQRLFEDNKLIMETPQVGVALIGDLIDNFDKSGHGGGVYEQKMLVPQQKAAVKTILGKLGNKVLWLVGGSHEEWSFADEGFDPTKYFARHVEEAGGGYWMGLCGIVNLAFPSHTFRVHSIHKPSSHPLDNPTLGIRKTFLRQHNFDVGITAHYHSPSVAVDYLKGQRLVMVCCGSYKVRDRYGKTNGYMDSPPLTPGILFEPKKGIATPFMDFKEALDYV